MLVVLRVDLVDDRRERGALARAGRTRHQNQPAAKVGERLDDFRQAELIEAWHDARDSSKDCRRSAEVLEVVAAKSAEVFASVREVDFFDIPN